MDLLDLPVSQRCLALTGAFETGHAAPLCFSGLAGNFDGMGVSFGALQWNLGQGTLQPMLGQFCSAHADIAADVFGGDLSAVQTMLSTPRDAQLEWAKSIQDGTGRAVGEPWKSRFAALGQTAEFQAIQGTTAQGMYKDAMAMCQRFGITTERAAALLFDIRVQNGTISSAVEALIRADFATIPVIMLPLDAEVVKLRSIANRRAEAANPKFVEDVRTRKLTVANGAGTVHGITYNLESQFGIRLQPMVAQ